MPRTAINYDNTIIYKIQHVDDDTLLYVGHTTDFTKRKSAHKANLNNTNNKAFNYKVYQMIRDNGGWDMFRMIEVKTFACSNKREAEAEEDRVMRELKGTMNTNRAFLTDEDKQIYHKTYKDEHSDLVKILAKKYRDKKRVEFESNFTMEKYSEHLKKQKEYRDAYKERQKNIAV